MRMCLDEMRYHICKEENDRSSLDQAIALSGREDQCYGNGSELHTERNSNKRRKEERAGGRKKRGRKKGGKERTDLGTQSKCTE